MLTILNAEMGGKQNSPDDQGREGHLVTAMRNAD